MVTFFHVLSILLVALTVIIVFFVIIVVHEWGHYKVAKLFGIRVDEFGFGYPPRIKTLFKRGETTFTLNALPFGGFVKIFGEDSVDESEENKKDVGRALFSKPKWQQALVLIAGVVMNIVLTWILFLFLFGTNAPLISQYVDPQYISDQHIVITDVSSESPAKLAGIKNGDIVKYAKIVEGKTLDVYTPEAFTSLIQNSKGASMELQITRDGKEIPVFVTPTTDAKNTAYHIGVGLSSAADVHLPFLKAVQYSFQATYTEIALIFSNFKGIIMGLFHHSTGPKIQVEGPVGIVRVISQALHYGISYVLYITAIISLNLAVLNVLPIPALDGGRLLFLLIEKIIGRSINIKTATIIHTVSFLVLIGLMLLVTFFDVVKLFK